MRPERERMETGFEILDEAHRSLVADSTKLFSVAEEHSEIDYSPELYTRDLYMTDEQAENRLDQNLKEARQSLQEMDAALTQIDEELHEATSTFKESAAYTEMLGRKRWYGEKYNQLMDELSELMSSEVLESTDEWNYQRAEYERPEENFQIEKGHERKASKTTAEGDR